MVLNTDNPVLPISDREDVDQPWAGDDQQWWDWYVTTAHNVDDDGELGPAPTFPDVQPADASAVVEGLAEPFPLTDEQITTFRTDGFIRLSDVVTPTVVAALAERLDQLLAAEFGNHTSGRFLSLEMMWRTDPLMCAVALSPRLGGIAADLLGEPAVRLYHDSALSKQPGCGRTPWHHDAEHFPLDSPQVATAWFPLHAVTAAMGPLSFAPGVSRADLGDLPVDLVGASYDAEVTARLQARRTAIVSTPFELGDVSFHSAGCFHTAGPNRTVAPRRVLSNTYMADGVRIIDQPTLFSGTWHEFVPGINPGQLAASGYNPIVGQQS